HLVGGDGHPLAVDRHVAVADELAGLVAAGSEHRPVGDVVEARLQHTEQVLAGDPLLAGGLLVEPAELLLQHSVDAAGLLLLPQLDHVLALPDTAAAVLPGGIGPALDGALHRVALRALQEELHLLPAAEAADRAGVTSHANSDPPPLGGAAAVVGDRRDVLDTGHLDPGVLDGADGGLPPRAGPLHQHVDLADAMLHRPAGGRLGRHLGGERRRLARPLEADVAGRGPGDGVPLLVGDRDDGVVERRLDVGDAVGDVLPFAPARSPSAWLGLGHCSPCPLVLSGLLLPGHGLLRALTGPGVRPGALPPHGEAAAVAEAGVTADLHLPLDVLGDLPAQV